MATSFIPLPLPTDPVSAGLTVLNTLLNFGILVYTDTPLPIRQTAAADWGAFTHGINTKILELLNITVPNIPGSTVTVIPPVVTK